MDVGSVDSVDVAGSSAVVEEGLSLTKSDKEGDRQIVEGLQRVGDRMVNYSYDFRPWSIRVIRAEDGESVKLEGVPVGVSYALVLKEVLPPLLQAHLERLARQELGPHVRGFVGKVEEKPITPSLEMKATASLDDQIAVCFQSEGFLSQTFAYVYEGKTYDVRIINNPDFLPLWAEGASNVVYFPYAILMAGLTPPKELVAHLKKMADLRWKKQTGYVPTSGFLFDDHFHRSAGLGPVLVNREGNMDATFDPSIRDCFASAEFINRVFLYEMEGKIYQVRIINNPEKKNIHVTKWFPDPYGIREYTVDWSYRYGIMVDQTAPSKLIKHIEDLARPRISWWDWYYGFDSKNGPQKATLKGGKQVAISYTNLFEYARP